MKFQFQYLFFFSFLSNCSIVSGRGGRSDSPGGSSSSSSNVGGSGSTGAAYRTSSVYL